MVANLKNRLLMLRKAILDSPILKPEKKTEPGFVNPFKTGWDIAALQVLKRTVTASPALPVPGSFPEALAVIVKDISCLGRIPEPGDLVFFDLETTGLSGGAGTLAFLASFGRFENNVLQINQYLLLDYPGEDNFLKICKDELSKPGKNNSPLIVSYNGKTFDSQILKSRCLMNAITPPDYFHADLLHPSRRFWKNIIPNCSQGTIETAILGLDRTGDTPGAMAPDIWFSFLKTGNADELAGICDHNIRDIKGLASIMLLLGNIAAAPLETIKTYNFDLEAMALIWRENKDEKEKETADMLLRAAAQKLMPRAYYLFGLDQLKTNAEQGRRLLLHFAASDFAPSDLKASALRALSVDAEWKERDLGKALYYTESAIALNDIRKSMKDELKLRKKRLQKKAKAGKRK